MSESWKKWECPPDMLTVEEKLKTLQMTERQLEEISLSYYDYEMKRATTPEEKAAWATLQVRKKSKLIKGNLQEGLVQEFQLWLQGRSKYNVKTIEEVKLNPLNNKWEKMKRECTPWGNRSLLHLKDVCEWLKLPILNRDKVAKSISVLKMTTPLDLEQAWIYYKYIVRGMAIDGAVLKEQRYANVFDYIEKRPLKTEIDPGTGRERTVEDDRFTPYSTDNPSMPRFNEQTYRSNYMRFSGAFARGDISGLIDDNETFSSFTPDDKLMLLIGAQVHAEINAPILEIVAEEGAAPVQIRQNVGPYLAAEIAGTLAEALGTVNQEAAAENKKQTEKIIRELKVLKEANIDIYENTNNVLREEFGKVVDIMDAIRKGGIEGREINIQMLRDLQDTERAMKAIIERDKHRPKPAKKKIVEARRPAAPAAAPPTPPKPRPVVVQRQRPELMVQNVAGAYIPPAPAVDDVVRALPEQEEEPVPVPAVPQAVPVEEEMDFIPFTQENMLPKLTDLNRATNRDLKKIGADSPIYTMLNTIMKNEVVTEIVKETSADLGQVVPAVREEGIERIERKVVEFKEVLENSPLIRAMVLNVDIDHPDLAQQYMEDVYKISKRGIDVDEKMAPLKRIHGHLARSGSTREVVMGYEGDDIANEVGEVLKNLTATIDLQDTGESELSALKQGIFEETFLPAKRETAHLRVEEFKEAVKVNKELGRDGHVLRRALQAAEGENTHLRELNQKLTREVEAAREMLNNPDGGLSDIIKEKVEYIGQFEVYAAEQEKKLLELSEKAASVDKFSEAYRDLNFQYERLKETFGEEKRLHQATVEEVTKHQEELRAYKQQMEEMVAGMTGEKQRLEIQIGKNQENIQMLNEFASVQTRQLTDSENKINALLQEKQAIINEAQQQLANTALEKQNLMHEITQRENVIKQLGGMEINDKYNALNQQKEELEHRLSQVQNEYASRLKELDRQVGELGNEKRELQQKTENDKYTIERLAGERNESNKKIQELESMVKEAKKNIEAENDKANRLFTNLTEYKRLAANKDNMLQTYLDGIANTEKQLQSSMEEAQYLRQQLDSAERLYRESASNAQQVVAEKDQHLIERENKIRERDRLLEESKVRIEELTRELAQKKEQVGEQQFRGQPGDSEKIKEYKRQLAELNKKLEVTERTKAEIERMRNEKLSKNETDVSKLNEHIRALEAKYTNNEMIRQTLETGLERRKAIQKSVDELSDRFLNSMKYMVSESHSNHISGLFQYNDNEQAFQESKVGKTLVEAWNELQKLKSEKSKDLKLIEQQKLVMKEYQNQINVYRQQSSRIIEAYEKLVPTEKKVDIGLNQKGVLSKKVGPSQFSMDYSAIAKGYTESAASIINELEKRGGHRAVANEDELKTVYTKKAEASKVMSSAINERSKLEATKMALADKEEQLLQEESALINSNRMTRQFKATMDNKIATIERQKALTERDLFAIESNINELKNSVDYFDSVISGNARGTTIKGLKGDSTMYFDQARGKSLEIAKTAAKNMMEAYADAIRTTPGLLYQLSDAQITDYIHTMTLVGKRIERAKSKNPETQELLRRLWTESHAMNAVKNMPPDQKAKLASKDYQSAFEKQYEIRRETGTAGDRADMELENRMPEVKELMQDDAEFAPSREQQIKDAKFALESIDKAMSRLALDEDEVKSIERFIDVYGKRAVGAKVLDKVRSKLSSTYRRMLHDPDEAIKGIFSDPSRQDAMADKMEERTLVGEKLLIKRTMRDLAELSREHANDPADDKNSKIIKFLSNKAPRVLEEILQGTILANALNDKELTEAAIEGSEHDLLIAKINAEDKMRSLDETIKYLSESFSSHSGDPEILTKFVADIEAAIGVKGKVRSEDLDSPMTLLMNSGDLENFTTMARTQQSVYGVDSDTLNDILKQAPEEDREKLAFWFDNLNREPASYENLDTVPYQRAIIEIGNIAKRTVTKRLVDKGLSPYDTHQNSKYFAPEVKRLNETVNRFTQVGATLESINYAADPKKKKNLVKIYRNASKSILYDTKRAMRDVDRLTVADSLKATSEREDLWNVRKAIVRARGYAQRKAFDMADSISKLSSKVF